MCWAFCKRLYRQKISNLKVKHLDINNYAVVLECLRALPNDLCKRCAATGWQKLMEAEPFQPEAALMPRIPPVQDVAPIEDINND